MVGFMVRNLPVALLVSTLCVFSVAVARADDGCEEYCEWCVPGEEAPPEYEVPPGYACYLVDCHFGEEECEYTCIESELGCPPD